jgi:hypothetical protein
MSAFDIPERSRPGPSLEHPRKDASLQKRKQGDIDDESGHCGPNKKNRNEEDDDHSAKKKAAAMWQSRLEYTRRAYQQWTDAYKGEHTRALGSDSPSNYGNKQAAEALSTPNIPNSTHSSSADLIPMYRMTECLVLYSFSDRTIVPMADKESNRYVYRPASQNPRFEICWGKKVPDMSLNLVFTPLARMYISPECMVSLPSRKHVASPDMVSLMDTLGSLQLPALDGISDGTLLANVQKVSNKRVLMSSLSESSPQIFISTTSFPSIGHRARIQFGTHCSNPLSSPSPSFAHLFPKVLDFQKNFGTTRLSDA